MPDASLDDLFICPECCRASYHPRDREEGYCGYCNAFTVELHEWLRAIKVEHDAGDLTDEEYASEAAFYRRTYLKGNRG